MTWSRRRKTSPSSSQRAPAPHQGDWGNVDDEDKQSNELSLKDGSRLVSAYEAKGLPKIWIITEGDRSATTILFPEEY